MNPLARLGYEVRGLVRAAGVVGAALCEAPRPWRWGRLGRRMFVRQLVLIGVEAVPLILLLAFVAGAAGVPQVKEGLSVVGSRGRIGEVLVFLLIEGLGPVLVVLTLIARSGGATTTALSQMQRSGGLRVLDAQGVDPFLLFVAPAILACTLAFFCLGILFVATALASGHFASVYLGLSGPGFETFLGTVAEEVGPRHAASFLLKTILPGLFMGAICCYEGMRPAETAADVRAAGTRAVVRALGFAFVITAAVSVASYV